MSEIELKASNKLASIIAGYLPDGPTVDLFWAEFEAAKLRVEFNDHAPSTSPCGNSQRDALANAELVLTGFIRKGMHLEERTAEEMSALVDAHPTIKNIRDALAEPAQEQGWCTRCGCGNDRHGFAHAPLCPTRHLTQEMRRLIIAARVVAFQDQGADAIKELDEASEAFADQVEWDDEPVAPPARSAASTVEPVAYRFDKGWNGRVAYAYAESLEGEEDRFKHLWQPLYAAPTTSPEPDAVRDERKSAWVRQISGVIHDSVTAMRIVELAELNGLFDAALSRPAHGGKSLSDYTLGELQSEVNWRAQQVLGDPRVGVTIPRNDRGSEAR